MASMGYTKVEYKTITEFHKAICEAAVKEVGKSVCTDTIPRLYEEYKENKVTFAEAVDTVVMDTCYWES